MTNDDVFALDIEWSSQDRPGLPQLVGPFATHLEARQWAKLNAARAVWTVRTLAWPYLRANPATSTS